MRFKRSESGQTLILVALSMTVLMGFVAFAANMGVMFQAQRNLQIAADAAATAGALAYNISGTTTSMQSAAESAAEQNGLPTNATIVTSGACSGSGKNAAFQSLICVYTPPVDGPNKGTTGYVEVMVRKGSPSGIIGMFTGSTTMNVAARAVAGTPPGKGCVFLLDTTGVDFELTQAGNMIFPNCDVYDDSTSTDAMNDTASGNVTANSISIVGGYSRSGSGTIDCSTCSPTTAPTTGGPLVGDPLAGLMSPPTTFGTCAPNTNVSKAGTIQPGCYDGLNINAGSGTVTLASGLYIINGTFNISAGGNTTVQSASGGVTFYFPNAGDQAKLTGAATMNLTAPTTATTIDGANILPNVLFYQNPSDTTQMQITESGTSKLTGIIYAPTANLDLTGSATSTLDTSLVLGSLTLTGSMNFEDLAFLPAPNPTTPPVLVE